MKQCQSCGMPLSMDKVGGGTEINGSISSLYCSNCYQNGEFTQKDITVRQMQDFNEEKLKEYKMNWFMRKLARRQLPSLQRRKSK